MLTIQQAFDAAVRHHEAGQLPEAENLYRQVLGRKPDHADALHLLGVIALQVGRYDAAVDFIGRAIAVRPNLSEAYNNLGIALKCKGENGEAIAAYRKAIDLKPNHPQAYSNLGNALLDSGHIEGSIAAFRQAIHLKPDYSDAYGNLGNALKNKGQLDEAIAAYRTATTLRPKYPEAYCSLGNAHLCKRQLDEAIAAYHQAIALRPNYAEAQFNLALVFLLQGNFSSGWAKYDWRLKCKSNRPSLRTFAQPQWGGEELNGRAILLHADQGYGDTIQFIRYAPLVRSRGGRVILECQPALHRLLGQFPGTWRVVASGQPLPDFDVQCPLLSLPGVFGTNLESIPNATPYLRADPELVARWRRRLQASGDDLKVGLAWAGDPTHANDRNRSMHLKQLARLAAVKGVSFHSLQKGPAAAQVVADPSDLTVTDWSAQLSDFAETAALIANLDLVVCVDTAMAHLAGALGKPVWLLLPAVPDWRWLLDREDSPWYPTMRLFRQKASGEWDDVVQRVARCLERR